MVSCSYEEPFKITIALKKFEVFLLFIHILLTVHFHLHLHASIVQSLIPTLKVKAFLFQLPVQNSSYTSKYIPSCGQKKTWGILHSIRSFPLSHVKAVNPFGGRTARRQPAEFPRLPLLKRAACCARLSCVTRHSGSWYAK